MQMHPLGRKGSLQRDDLELPAQDGGLIKPWTGKAGLAEVANNTQDKT
jgi:hypothetical protein